MAAKTVYATLDNGLRIGAVLGDDGRILVHIVNEGMVGWYSFSGPLTPTTLRARLQK